MNPPPTDVFIFLAGIHGVGKSTLCREVFEPAGFHCVSASSIIKNAEGDVSATKAVGDVRSNQSKLLSGLNGIKRVYQRFVIDGHFALSKPNGGIECIDPDVFREMGPDVIVVVRADPNLIAYRLRSRDQLIWTSEFISEFQDREIAHAHKVAAEIGISLHIVSSREEALQLLPHLS